MVFKRNLLGVAFVSATLMAGTGAWAQTSDQSSSPTGEAQTQEQEQDTGTQTQKATQLGTIEITGFAQSLRRSIALKQSSDSIVEAVSAEQIGKLPGSSIADTLGRLPGLAVQRVSGRPSVLTIHGLGPDFSTALINGHQQVSTGNNRGVQFDQYPSSWFSDVVVHMSPSASLIGQGLAGTVDLHTIRPLETSDPVAVLNGYYIWNGMSQLADGPGASNTGYKLNGVWARQFADHTFGVTLGVSFVSSPTQIQHQAPWGYPPDANGDLVIGGSKNYGITDSLKRQGLLATFQWQPNEHYTGTIDLTYSNFDETQQAKGMEFPFFWGTAAVSPVPTLVPGNVVDGFVQTGTWKNINTVVRNDYNKTSANVYNFNFDNEIFFNAAWSADFGANYSRATRDDLLLESYSGTGYYYGPNGHGATQTLHFAELAEQEGLLWINNTPDYTSGQVLTDPEGWGSGSDVVQAGFINAPHTVDSLLNLQASATRGFSSGPFSGMEFGVVRSVRKKTYDIDQNFLTLGGGTISGGHPVPEAPIGTTNTCEPLTWMGVGPQICYNPFDLIHAGTLVKVPTFQSSLPLPPNWEVREEDWTGYVKFNLDTYLGNVSLRGNFGLQAVHTKQTSDGEKMKPGVVAGVSFPNGVQLVPVTGGASFNRYLPSMNLVFGFTPDDDLRVSAARTMARPRMDQMNASLGVSGNITHLASTDPNEAYFSASGGNAELLPTMANNYNVSYEHYFSGTGYQCNASDSKTSALCNSGGGYVALSAYYLSLMDYINPNAAYLYDFKDFVDTYLTSAQQAQLGTTMGIVSGPRNDGDGYVRGYQLVLNLPLNVITPALKGLGVILSGNHTKSEITLGDNPEPITVPGLSEWVANATIYYQYGGFQARITDNYRGDFLGRVSGVSAKRVEQIIEGGSTYAAQVSYTFQNGLTLIARGSNLTNKTFVTYDNKDPRQVRTWERYGRRFAVGVSYRF